MDSYLIYCQLTSNKLIRKPEQVKQNSVLTERLARRAVSDRLRSLFSAVLLRKRYGKKRSVLRCHVIRHPTIVNDPFFSCKRPYALVYARIRTVYSSTWVGKVFVVSPVTFGVDFDAGEITPG